MSTKMKAHLLVEQFPWLAKLLTILVAYGAYKLLKVISMDIVGAIALLAIGAFALHTLKALTKKPSEDEDFDSRRSLKSFFGFKLNPKTLVRS